MTANTVYVVIAGHKYEGEDAESIQVFTSREVAEEWGQAMLERKDGQYGGPDYYMIVERDVMVRRAIPSTQE